MKNHNQSEIFITGLGVTSAIGQGKTAFISTLLQGQHAFEVMQRPGRQSPVSSIQAGEGLGQATSFLGAEISNLSIPESLPQRVLHCERESSRIYAGDESEPL